MFFVHVNFCCPTMPWLTLKWGTVSWWIIPFVLFAVSLLSSLQFFSPWLQALIVKIWWETFPVSHFGLLSCYPPSSCEMYSACIHLRWLFLVSQLITIFMPFPLSCSRESSPHRLLLFVVYSVPNYASGQEKIHSAFGAHSMYVKCSVRDACVSLLQW